MRSLYILESRTSKFVCNFALVLVLDVFGFSKDFADSISAFKISAFVGRLAPEDTSLLKFIARAGHFRNAAALGTGVYQLLFSWRRYLSPIVRAQPQEHSHFEVSLWDPQDMQY